MSIGGWLLIYYGIGLIEWFFGTPTRELKDRVWAVFKEAPDPIYRLSPAQIRQRVILAKVLIFLLCTSFYPLFYFLKFFDRIDRKQHVRVITKHYDEDKLYFHLTAGCGDIHCQTCGYTEQIKSFTHGLNASSTGVQCQMCGKFTTYESGSDVEGYGTCECGGELARDEAMFCPSCGSYELKFDLRYIT